jgi:hypothetical protein
METLKAFLLSKGSPETLKTLGFRLIIWGLIAEAIVIVFVPSGGLEKTLSAIFTLAIAAGVWIEGIGFDAIAAMSKRTRREVLEGKLPLITETLKPFANISFDAGIGPNDKDVEDFLWDLEPGLWAAGWKQIDWQYSDFQGGGSGQRRGNSGRPAIGRVAASNVSIQIHPGQEPLFEEAAKALVAILKKTGFEAQIDGFNIHNANARAIHVLIGPRR